MVSDPFTGQASPSSRCNVKVKKEKDAGGDHIMTSHKHSSNSVAAVVKTEKCADEDDIRGNVKQEPQAVPPTNGSSQNKKRDIATTSQARHHKKARTSTLKWTIITMTLAAMLTKVSREVLLVPVPLPVAVFILESWNPRAAIMMS